MWTEKTHSKPLASTIIKMVQCGQLYNECHGGHDQISEFIGKIDKDQVQVCTENFSLFKILEGIKIFRNIGQTSSKLVSQIRSH